MDGGGGKDKKDKKEGKGVGHKWFGARLARAANRRAAPPLPLSHRDYTLFSKRISLPIPPSSTPRPPAPRESAAPSVSAAQSTDQEPRPPPYIS